ncbi:hypothetical protein [Actinoplanes solisilvae]|uniref:hypothetical protein n=1 Tax=Actinoplanes solisilvae TaxID=2486853 RepID=UPI000FD95C62|nr:hypothetical protein [Actinoplanes solisilvae]
MTQLLVLRAVVEAPCAEVAELLLDVRPGGRSPIAVRGTVEETDTGNEFVVVHEGSRVSVSVDPASRTVAQQGEWWYRGVYQVEPDPRGSVIEFRILNVAPRARWAVRFVARKPLADAPAQFADQVERLGQALGVKAWVDY